MGADDRSPSRAVIEQLLARPQRFNLFQAISLLEQAYPDTPAPWEQQHAGVPPRLRLRSHVSLSFEASDIRSLRAPDDETFELETPLMGLAGAMGALPTPFTEMVLERKARRDHAMAEFLDIFNHRLLTLLYLSRRKRHVALHQQQAHAAPLTRATDAIGALGLRQNGDDTAEPMQPWLRHAGLLGGAPRSMSTLLVLLRDRLGLTVQGQQFEGAWLPLSDGSRARLGRGSLPLGQGAVLGGRIWDQGAGIRLRFPALTLDQLQSLLPQGREHRRVQWLVGRHLPQRLHVTLELQPAPRIHRTPTLGGRHSMRLGWTSWLAGSHFKGPLPPVTVKLASTSA